MTVALAAAPPPPDIRPGLVAFEPIAIPDDVPAHLVSALAQDADGFLWIGTQGGLVRYDGYAFRTYRPDPRDPATIGGAYVRTLRVASDGRIWIGTFADGVSVYDPATDRFTRFRHDPADPRTLAANRVEGLAEDHNGRMWVATYGGLDRIDPSSGAIEHFRHDPKDPFSLAADRTRGLLVDAAGTLWVGSTGGVQRLAPGTRRFEPVGPGAGEPGSLAGLFVSALFQDSRGRVWMGTMDGGGALFDPGSGAWRRYLLRSVDPAGLDHFWIYGFAEVAGEIWIATFGGGIDVVDMTTLAIVERLRNDPALPTALPEDRVGALFRDRSGLVWVGTWGRGLVRHDPSSRAFRGLRFSPQQPDGLSHRSVVRALEAPDGTLWAGTNGNGIDVLDRELHRQGGYRPDPREPGALADGSVTCLASTSDGSMWAATLDGTLHRRRPGAAGFERLTAQNGLPGGPIRAMREDGGGGLWIASANGLARLDTRTGTIRAYRHDPADPHSLASNTIESVAIMPDGVVWAGSDAGLNVVDAASGRVTRVLHDAARADSLPADWVPDLAIVGDRLWVATQGGAAILAAWDGRVARFETLAAKLRRPPAPVDAIVEDASGSVWLGPRLRVNPRTWEAQDFGPSDGVAFRTFFIASRARTAAGALLFGSPEGLLVVEPAKIADWTYRPATVLTSLRVDGMDRRFEPGGRPIVLPPRTRGFDVGFAALDLSAPDRLAYRYRLDGYDSDWIIAGSGRRSVTYTNLAPGSYTLHVEGSNRARQWSGRDVRLAIVLRPAFYQTRWFAAGLFALVCAMAYGSYRLRVRQLQRRSRELELVVAERTADLQKAYARIEEASLTDPVTGVRNRRFLEQAIAPDLELARRRARTESTGPRGEHICLLLDLDHFKSVNDRYGHAAGDAVLRQTAEVLRSCVRASDYVVRWGGEEFLVVARFDDRRDGPAIAEKIRSAVEAHEFSQDDTAPRHVTCSVGVAVYPFSRSTPDAVSWEAVIAAADEALYEAKRGGRNRWVSRIPDE